MMNVVVLGATGHFGERISRRIVGEPNTRLIVSSRNQGTAHALASSLDRQRSGIEVSAAVLDQDSDDFESRLLSLDPDIVIHTAGPYQGRSYRVAEACIECGSHYVDLADGREFVSGFSRLNDRALATNVLLVSGASTLPGLSSVVVAELRNEFSEINSIDISIAPAHKTPRGIGTVAAVLSYCGRPFTTRVEGQWQRRFGWQDLRGIRYEDLGYRWAAACDVPDLDLFPKYLNDVETVTFHAALESKLEQLGLWLMAAAVRTGFVADWSKYAARLQNVSRKLMFFGSDRGGMRIRLDGLDTGGKCKSAEWNLVAEQNHGPEIPCTPALIIARKLASGNLRQRGAMPCWNLFTLRDFDTEVSDFDIRWRIKDQAD